MPDEKPQEKLVPVPTITSSNLPANIPPSAGTPAAMPTPVQPPPPAPASVPANNIAKMLESVPARKAGTPEYSEPLQSGQYPLTPKQPTPPEMPKPQAPLQDVVEAMDGAEPTKKVDIKSYKDSPIETLRTFESDVALAVKKGNTSVIKMAVAEQKRKIERHELPEVPDTTPQAAANPYKESRKNFAMIFVSIFLVIAGGGIGFYAYTFFSKPPAPLSVSLPGNPIISTEHQREVQVGSNTADVIDLIVTEKNQDYALGAISSIYFTKSGDGGRQYLSTQEFFKTTGIQAPENLIRALDDKFMLGVHMIKGGRMFLILKTSFYQGAFPAMLEWESTMVQNLEPLTGAQITTSGFQDRVIQNKDTREIMATNGNVALVYSFIDKNNIVIAEDEETLAEITRRLNNAAKTLR
jgi:hypothetical protein